MHQLLSNAFINLFILDTTSRERHICDNYISSGLIQALTFQAVNELVQKATTLQIIHQKGGFSVSRFSFAQSDQLEREKKELFQLEVRDSHEAETTIIVKTRV